MNLLILDKDKRSNKMANKRMRVRAGGLVTKS